MQMVDGFGKQLPSVFKGQEIAPHFLVMTGVNAKRSSKAQIDGKRGTAYFAALFQYFDPVVAVLAAKLFREDHGHYHEPRRRVVTHANNDIGHERTGLRVEDRLAVPKIPGRITETQRLRMAVL